jgi:chitodextrinase
LTATAISSSQIGLSWSAGTDNVGVTGYRLYRDGVQMADVAVTSYSDTGLSAARTYGYTVSAYDAAGNESAKSAVVSVNTPALTPTPYSGTPIDIPGTFEAENFDRGGEGVAYHDNVKGNAGGQYRLSEDVDIIVSTAGGYVVNNFETGEWLAYTINVAASALYDIEIRASSQFSNSAFHVEIDGVNVTGTVTVPNTGEWNIFQWVGKKGVALAAGLHVLKIVADQQYFDLNAIRVVTADVQAPSVPANLTATAISSSQIGLSWSAGTDNVGVTGYRLYRDGVQVADVAVTSYSDTGLSAARTYGYTVSAYDAAGNESAKSAVVSVNTPALTPTPYSGTPIAIPGTFEAENFDVGGEGFGYHDNVKGNAGGQYRTSEDVDIIVSSDALGGGYVVNNFETGEWLAYTINVAAAALYDIEIRATSGFSNSAFHVEIDGVNVTGTVTVPTSPSWSTFQWVGKKGVALAAGQHVLKIVADQQYFDLNTIRVTTADTQAPTIPANLTATAASSSRIALSWSAATDNTGVTGYQVYRNGIRVAAVSGTTYSDAGLSPATTYSYAIAAYDAAGNVSAQSSSVSAATPPGPIPYSGTPIVVPGTFEAENFDVGGEGFGYHDNVKGNAGGQYRVSEDVDIALSSDALGGGYVVNNFETGEWLAYTINVAATGVYDIEIRAATGFLNSAFHVEIDGVNVTGTITVPNTPSWSTFTWVGKKGVALTSGIHVLKIVSDQQYFDLNSVRIVAPVAVGATPPDFSEDFVGVSFPGGDGSYSSPNPPSTWYVQQAAHGRISVVGAPGGVGGYAMRSRTEVGDTVSIGGHRADATPVTTPGLVPGPNWQQDICEAAGGLEGQERWYAQSIYFPSTEFIPPPSSGPSPNSDPNGGWAVFMDFHPHYNGPGQNFQLEILRGEGFQFKGYGGPGGGNFWRKVIAPTPTVDMWYDFVYRIKWTSSSAGFVHIWINGKLFHQQNNQPTLFENDCAYWKIANYHDGGASTVYHRRIRIGKTADSVASGPLEGVLTLVDGVLTPLQ